MGERENNEIITSLDSDLHKVYVFYRLSGGRKGYSETAYSVALKSKAKLFLMLEGKGNKTVPCRSELSSQVQLRC